MEKNIEKESKKLLDLLRWIDFALIETGLYLDAYPNAGEALAYYHKLCRKRAQIVGEYERKCGPLTMYGNENHGTWDWAETPWPWQSDAD